VKRPVRRILATEVVSTGLRFLVNLTLTEGGVHVARVTLQHIWKKYTNDVAAVKDFNLDIEDKEFVVFGLGIVDLSKQPL
jgi:hypothetical protein